MKYNADGLCSILFPSPHCRTSVGDFKAMTTFELFPLPEAAKQALLQSASTEGLPAGMKVVGGLTTVSHWKLEPPSISIFKHHSLSPFLHFISLALSRQEDRELLTPDVLTFVRDLVRKERTFDKNLATLMKIRKEKQDMIYDNLRNHRQAITFPQETRYVMARNAMSRSKRLMRKKRGL